MSLVVLARAWNWLLGGKAQGCLGGTLLSAASFFKGYFFLSWSICSPQEKELLEVSPPPTSVHEAIVQGDRRTYAVYDLLSPSLFNTSRSLNVQLKWKRPQDSCE